MRCVSLSAGSGQDVLTCSRRADKQPRLGAHIAQQQQRPITAGPCQPASAASHWSRIAVRLMLAGSERHPFAHFDSRHGKTMRRVVVTGLGAVTPLGVGARRTWSRLLAGDSGLIDVSTTEPRSRWKGLTSTVSGIVPSGKAGKAEVRFQCNEWIRNGAVSSCSSLWPDLTCWGKE